MDPKKSRSVDRCLWMDSHSWNMRADAVVFVSAVSSKPSKFGMANGLTLPTRRSLLADLKTREGLKQRSMLHGWIILDKPVGLGSTTAVSAVKRILREAGEPKTKVGHGGTLDPLASGVLPIALGEATKLCGRMLNATKVYDFTIRFGEGTDKLDAEGEVIARSDVLPTVSEVEAVLPRFTGAIEQVP